MASRDSAAGGTEAGGQLLERPCPDNGSFPALWDSFRLWWILCLIPAAIHACAYAHEMNPDGLVYLDMATGALRYGPSSLVNPLWSPGYPALLAAGLAVFQPSPASGFPFIHLLTFCTYILALGGFTYFLRSWIALPIATTSHSLRGGLVPLSFSVFLWISIEFIGLWKITPDLLMSAAVFAAAGICSRLYSGTVSNRILAALGAVLALGYYSKAPMFPMGIALLALLALWPPQGFDRRRILLPATVFILLSSPLIALLSAKTGRFSLGESGRLNYIWHVNGLPSVGWTGDSAAASGQPVHPPRILLENPRILEFATPVNGTYPLWYDPAYWYAGARPRFSFSGQVKVLVQSAQVYWWSAQMQTILIGGALSLLALAGRSAASRRPRGLDALLLCWAAAACLMFAFVHAEYRYVAAFLILAWIALYSHLGANLALQPRRSVYLCLAFVVLIQLASGLPKLASAALAVSRGTPTPPYVQVAGALRSLGLRPGDPLATIGPAFEAYYARHLGSRVIAQVSLDDPHPALTPADWDRIRNALSRAGVRALISPGVPAGAIQGDWITLLPGSHSVMLIPAADSRSR